MPIMVLISIPSFGVCGQATFTCQQRLQPMQEDDNKVSTARVPIVLATQECSGGEQAITACPNFQLRRPPTVCRHESDVHLVCYNGPNPGVTTLRGRLNSGSIEH